MFDCLTGFVCLSDVSKLYNEPASTCLCSTRDMIYLIHSPSWHICYIHLTSHRLALKVAGASTSILLDVASLKKFKCTFLGCNSAFDLIDNLNKHAGTHKPELYEIRCTWPACDRGFAFQSQLTYHLAIDTSLSCTRSDVLGQPVVKG